jgi:hypothetical protein
MTETPATNTYTSVISWKSVCIALTLAAFNVLGVKLITKMPTSQLQFWRRYGMS